ncbi:hypothetical protein V1514DRAFT_328312 [Lipomyces japonicus]|uniref:uncharacterized protein n=1 Tax=Lipomyces japonicus TaxID=56871 RepID=UPI0034CDA530
MTEWHKGPPCGFDNCSSTLYHLVEGLQYCRNGHQTLGEIELATDDEDFGAQGRTVRIRRNAGQRRSAGRSKAVYGRQGYVLYLRCMQLIIRAITAWVIRARHAPDKLDQVVKALWIMYLEAKGINRLKLSFDDEEHDNNNNNNNNDDDDDGSFQDRLSQDSQTEQPGSTTDGHSHNHVIDLDLDEGEQEDEVKFDSENDGYSSSSSFSSSSSSSSNVADSSHHTSSLAPTFITIRLPEAVALVYISCRILHLPVFLHELYAAARTFDMPYMRVLATSVPFSMRSRLETRYTIVMAPVRFPLPGSFLTSSTVVATVLHDRFRLRPPALPRTLLVVKYVHALMMPLEVAAATLRLLDLLNLPLKFGSSSSTSPTKTSNNRKFAMHPELIIMLAVIISVKLCYGLDKTWRVPETVAEPASQEIDWHDWKLRIIRSVIQTKFQFRDSHSVNVTKMANISEKTRIRRHDEDNSNVEDGQEEIEPELSEFDVNPDDPVFWTSTETDEFLKFYQRAWVVTDLEEQRHVLADKHFLDLFPLPGDADEFVVESSQMVERDDMRMIPASQSDHADAAAGIYSQNNLDLDIEIMQSKLIQRMDRQPQQEQQDINLPQVVRPAEKYEIHHVFAGAPDMSAEYDERLRVLYVAAAKIVGCNILQLRKGLKSLESKCANL